MEINRRSTKKAHPMFLIPTIIFIIIWAIFVVLWFVLPDVKEAVHVLMIIGYIGVALTSLSIYVVIDIYKQLTKSKDEILKNATIDEITGLPTSKRLKYKYEEISHTNKGWGLAIVVINHSDNFNALFGFKLYKEYLVKTGEILSDFVTEKGTVAYLNSGRYSMIFPYTGEKQLVISNLINMFNAYSNSEMFSESIAKNYIRSYSCGLYFFDGTPIDIDMPKSRLKSMLQGNDGNSIKDFTEEINSIAKVTEELSPYIEKAFSNNEFKTYYQPKFDTITKRVIGAELFARWELDGETITPARFIPVLQNTGRILDLDLLMIKDACEVMSNWIAKKTPPIPLAVNISKYTALDKRFIDRLTELVAHYKIPNSLIQIEMSQSSLIYANETLLNIAEKLEALGFTISLDDVGSQNNAVELIRILNSKVVKFSEDYFLLSDISENNEKILKASVKFFNDLGIVTVAKNVGTQEYFTLAKKCECTNVQGFLFCEPMNSKDFFEYLVVNKIQLEE